MRVGDVIGKITLSKCEPSLEGASWKLVVPLALEALQGKTVKQKEAGRGEAIVVFDDRGAGIGSTIAISEGTEAAAPFYPEVKPIDAYNAAILDSIDFG